MGEYTLRCPVCGETIDDCYTNACIKGCNGLVYADYSAKQISVRDLPGMFRYHDWLPVSGWTQTDTCPATYRSEGLADHLGLKNLYIAFNGYWPEKGAFIRTCSFKELEAVPTMLRIKERLKNGILQISSAGNTGRAFAEVSAGTGNPVIISVPKKAAGSIWTTKECDSVFLVTIEGDYSDAIALGNEICTIPGVVSEGGAKNPARRDGMGTVMLDGTMAIGKMPDWYFQAVGSGTGGIAAWEMGKRLLADGRFGNRLPRLYLSQNEPFVPMVNAWAERRREIIPEKDMPGGKEAAMETYATVLTNRNPPYSITGGLFDALSGTNGIMRGVKSGDAKKAGRLFMDLEGPDLDPAAEVCVASLISAVESGDVNRDDNILLNITGGGYRRAAEDLDMIPVRPSASLRSLDEAEELKNKITEWMRKYA